MTYESNMGGHGVPLLCARSNFADAYESYEMDANKKRSRKIVEEMWA